MKIIQQGAEAVIYLDDSKNLIKERISKSYRIPELDDKIRKLRTRSETKLLEKSGKIIPVPNVINSNEKDKKIIMEFIDGKKLSDNLNSFSLEKQKKIISEVGNSLAKIHNENLIHGDLTTSNLILKGEKIFFIDFGLGYHSAKLEDKAVDIHLFKQALEAKHFDSWEILFKEFLNSYSSECKDAEKVLLQLEKVEKRGRYRH